MKMKKIFYGWYIVIFCALLMAICYAPLVSCASLFIKPITEELGFSRSAYTLVSTIMTLLCVVLSPLVGRMMSQKYMHLILTICIAGVSICYASYATASTLPGFYVRGTGRSLRCWHKHDPGIYFNYKLVPETAWSCHEHCHGWFRSGRCII